ncbi:hypothetical protein H671_6g16477 [Cricetulus griseus]|nr:hypothetical protein H671_6g16477 [Cricetulus griseus]
MSPFWFLILLICKFSLCFLDILDKEQFEEYRYHLLFEFLVEFCSEAIWPWAFFGWEVLMTAYISLEVMGRFKLFI